MLVYAFADNVAGFYVIGCEGRMAAGTHEQPGECVKWQCPDLYGPNPILT